MKKKFVLCLVILTALVCLPSFVTQFATAEGTITPYYTHTSSIAADLYLDGNQAVCAGTVRGSSSQTNTRVVVTLQKRVSGGSTFGYVTAWTDTSTGTYIAGVTGRKTVASGYDYRVLVRGTITNAEGVILEQTSRYSSIVSY